MKRTTNAACTLDAAAAAAAEPDTKRKKSEPSLPPSPPPPERITPATPGYEHLSAIIKDHCRLSGEMNALLKIASMLHTEARQKKFADVRARDNKETSRVFFEIVFLGRDALDSFNPFPLHFKSDLENVMVAELRVALNGSFCLYDMMDLDATEDEKAKGMNSPTFVYYSAHQLPRKYREILEDAVQVTVRGARCTLSPRTPDMRLTEHDLSVLRAYSTHVLSFMQRAIQRVKDARLCATPLKREYTRYKKIVDKVFLY